MKMIDKDSPSKNCAMHILGKCFEYGEGLPANSDTAIYWYERAAEEGNEESVEKLENLKKAGD